MNPIFNDVIHNPAYNEKPLALVIAGSSEIDQNVITTRLNYFSAVLIFNTIVKTMKQYKENEIKLVFISSVGAKKISVGNSLYGSTKATMV